MMVLRVSFCRTFCFTFTVNISIICTNWTIQYIDLVHLRVNIHTAINNKIVKSTQVLRLRLTSPIICGHRFILRFASKCLLLHRHFKPTIFMSLLHISCLRLLFRLPDNSISNIRTVFVLLFPPYHMLLVLPCQSFLLLFFLLPIFLLFLHGWFRIVSFFVILNIHLSIRISFSILTSFCCSCFCPIQHVTSLIIIFIFSVAPFQQYRCLWWCTV